MLPKRARMPRELFSELLAHSRYANSPHFTLRYRIPADSLRAGVSVSKKVSKKATVRNTIRRRAYSFLSSHLNTIPLGLYLFVAKPGAEKCKGELLKKELEELIHSISKLS